MRLTFHAELDELITDLARATRLSAWMMTSASSALRQTDLTRAELVVTDGDQLTLMLEEIQRRCVTLLALQAPVARDLRVVVATLHAVGHLRRMGRFARHIAQITRLKHPNPMIEGEVRSVIGRTGLLASQLAIDAAAAIEHRDPLSCDRLAAALFARDWAHGVEPAVDAALIGRYYERFAEHAVAIARQACYLATGRIPERNA